jgi:N-acetylglucosamine-6-sulfatase
MLTGLYPHKHQVINNDKLGLDVVSHTLMTFPRLLRMAGYETAFVGKWHMGLDDSRRPGFDRWFSFKGQGQYLDPVVNDDGAVRQLDGYMTDHINRQALEWVNRPRHKPFCMIVSHKVVHAPYLPAPRHENLYADYKFTPPAIAKGDLAGKFALNRKLDELYDLRSDPQEEHNVASTAPAEALSEMRQELARLISESK